MCRKLRQTRTRFTGSASPRVTERRPEVMTTTTMAKIAATNQEVRWTHTTSTRSTRGGKTLGGDDDEPDFDGEDDMSDAASDISEEDEVQVMGGEGVGEEEAAEAEAAWTRANAAIGGALCKR